jgi:hypothetical protein
MPAWKGRLTHDRSGIFSEDLDRDVKTNDSPGSAYLRHARHGVRPNGIVLHTAQC